MFQAFTQADGSDTRSKGGTGLGLNIAREIVKRQGGQIGFEQFADRRTVFWFTCPLSEMDAAVDRPALPPDAPHVLYLGEWSEFFDAMVAGFSGLAVVDQARNLQQAMQPGGS
jgi:hypothetical protein